MHEIHNSERKSFRGCRRRWNWAYREGIVPIDTEERFDFGIAFHRGMETFYTPEAWKTTDSDEKAAAALESFLLECELQRRRYLETHKLTELPQEVDDNFRNRLDLGAGMLAYHAKYVHPKEDDWFRPVAVEIPFEVPLLDPDRPGNLLRCTSSPFCGQNHSNDRTNDDSIVVYAGRVDALMEDVKWGGGYWIWDHKTAATLANDEEFLQLDDQVGGYCWALSIKLNLAIKGFIYAECRKDFPRQPRLLKRTQKGCQFSTAKTQATSIEIFEPYVAKHDPEAFLRGCYDEYLDYLRGSGATLFSQRFTVIKTDLEQENIGENIAIEAADMVDSKLRIYPNVSRFHCKPCKYREPCHSMFLGEDVDYLLGGDNFTQTDRRYWMEESRQAEKVDVE